jgi:hypothetical protein
MNSLSSKQLEDSFFSFQDQKLIEDLRIMRKMKETKESLSAVSGIKNDAVLEKLVSLDIRPETLASLSLVPLIEVAWADGNIDSKEQNAILSAMEKKGLSKPGDVNYDIVKQWMTHRPSADLLDAWTHYIQGLCEQLSGEEKKSLQAEIMENAKAIAESSGGFLGTGIGGTVSKPEKEMLARLEAAFK